jgi:hypothetical protein
VFVVAEFQKQALGGAHGFIMAEFGFRGERAVVGIVDDFVDGFPGESLRVRFGQVVAGDLEGVEDQAGAARVEGAGGEVLDDQADGKLDGGAVLGQREREEIARGRPVL